MPTEKVEFDAPSGCRLIGRLELPQEEPRALVLFAHCFTCTKNLTAATNISRGLVDRGFGVLRFDFTGLGESEGDFADTNFSSNVEDLVGAARFLEDSRTAPSLLVGHSLGGAAVLQAASRLGSVRAVATIGAPAEPSHVRKLLRGSEEEIRRSGETEIVLAGRPFKIKRQFLEDLESARMESWIRNLDRALLICHAPLDDTVGVDNARRIFETARHPKSFLSLDGADHLLSRREDSRYVGEVIAVWSQRYVS